MLYSNSQRNRIDNEIKSEQNQQLCAKMTYLLTFTLIISLKGVTTTYSNSPLPYEQHQHQHHQHQRHQHSSVTECGVRLARRQPRNQQQQQQQNQHHVNQQNNNNNRKSNEQFFYNMRIPKIIAGSLTKEGQFPWQVSLELLHPSMGFLGHWCGGVLIDQYWILSAAHCVDNDLFNLPLPPLWTVVLGEYDRSIESGYEQRIPVEKIVLHESYHNFLHDLVLMKLSLPANFAKSSIIRKICLPFYFEDNLHSNLDMISNPIPSTISSISPSLPNGSGDFNTDDLDNLYPLDDNFLRFVQGRNKNNFTLPSMKELLTTKIINRLKKTKTPVTTATTLNRNGRQKIAKPKRRNDKLMQGFSIENYYDEPKHANIENNAITNNEFKDLPYVDCIATGWGKSNATGDLTDILLKTKVPLHSSSRCKDAYGGFVKIHRGHLCAGKLNGKGGTCVGDSGGPLQCRLNKNGPWILAGVTSFGSGCALEGFPDVYTRTSFYMKWIRDTINNE